MGQPLDRVALHIWKHRRIGIQGDRNGGVARAGRPSQCLRYQSATFRRRREHLIVGCSQQVEIGEMNCVVISLGQGNRNSLLDRLVDQKTSRRFKERKGALVDAAAT